MPELDHLRAAIVALEQQRSSLGDDVVDAAIAPLRQRIDSLAEPKRAQAEGERKQVTIMFADLSGFTALSERVDPEQVRNVVNSCFERVGVIVTRYGGYIDKFIGDELMVLFGAPRAMEDHASRALHAAIEIRDAVSAFNREHALLHDYSLSMHFGINTGLVIAGAMGTESRREYTVIGDAVNVAARLVSRADRGEILVGRDTRRLVDTGFQFEHVGAVELDGRVQLTEIFRLLAARADARSTRDVGVGDTPMFGRTWELQTMKDVFGDAVSNRRARSVVVVGPAGIGKSRLLGEFLAWHRVEIVASLPYYRASQTDAQRGEGVFEKSIQALRLLNRLGYGQPGSGLSLNLVCNPVGAFLPPKQEAIEAQFRKELRARHGIEFNHLYTITNMPISRFLEFLLESGNYEQYMERLANAFNPTAAAGVMCRYTISVSWDGTLYDCDFNQMLDLPLDHRVPAHIRDFDPVQLNQRQITTRNHCYGCTAGAGSSCGGSVTS